MLSKTRVLDEIQMGSICRLTRNNTVHVIRKYYGHDLRIGFVAFDDFLEMLNNGELTQTRACELYTEYGNLETTDAHCDQT